MPDEYVIVEKSTLDSIGDTVRSATGSTNSISVNNLNDAVAAAVTSGGGLRLIKTVTLAETVKSITVDTDDDGNAFSLSEIYIMTNATNSEDQTDVTFIGVNINGKNLMVIGTTSPMNFVGGKPGESGRNWIWLMSLNPLRVLHGEWITSNISSVPN